MRIYQYYNPPHYNVVSEDDVRAAKEKAPARYHANADKVLALGIGESVSFESGAMYTRLADDSPRINAIVCSGRTSSRPCRFCHARVRDGRLCDFPVQGKKKSKTCDLFMCAKCATRVGPDRDYCPNHRGLQEPGL